MKIRMLIQVAAQEQSDFFTLDNSDEMLLEYAITKLNEVKALRLKKRWKLADGSTHLAEFEKQFSCPSY